MESLPRRKFLSTPRSAPSAVDKKRITRPPGARVLAVRGMRSSSFWALLKGSSKERQPSPTTVTKTPLTSTVSPPPSPKVSDENEPGEALSEEKKSHRRLHSDPERFSRGKKRACGICGASSSDVLKSPLTEPLIAAQGGHPLKLEALPEGEAVLEARGVAGLTLGEPVAATVAREPAPAPPTGGRRTRNRKYDRRRRTCGVVLAARAGRRAGAKRAGPVAGANAPASAKPPSTTAAKPTLVRIACFFISAIGAKMRCLARPPHPAPVTGEEHEGLGPDAAQAGFQHGGAAAIL